MGPGLWPLVLVLGLLVGCRGDNDVEVIDAYTALRGSCYSDSECSPTFFCNSNGFCEIRGPGTVRGFVLTVAQSKLVAGLVAFGVCFCTVFLGLVMNGVLGNIRRCNADCCDNENFLVKTFFYVVSAVLCGIAIGLAIGLPLTWVSVDATPSTPGAGAICASRQDLRCDPYFCDVKTHQCYQGCETDFHCVDGTTCSAGACVAAAAPAQAAAPSTTPKYATWVAPTAAMLTSTCFAIFMSAVASCCCRRSSRQSLARFIGSIGCIALALGLGCGLGLAKSTVAPQTPAVSNTTTCVSNAPCAPFLCDTTNFCRISCGSDADCITGFQCNTGSCERAEDTVGTMLRRIPVWATVITTLFVPLGLGIGVAMVCLKARDSNPGLCGICGFIWVFLVSGLIIGLSLGIPVYNRIGVNRTPVNGTHCAQVDAVACAPYFCNLYNNNCLSSCSSDNQCVATAQCQNKVCVARDQVSPPAKRWSAGVVVAFFFMTAPFLGGLAALGYYMVVDDWEPKYACLTCLIVFVVTALAVGLSTGLVTATGDTSSDRAPLVLNKYPPWMAAVVGAAAAYGVVIILILITRFKLPIETSWFQNFETWPEDEGYIPALKAIGLVTGSFILIFLMVSVPMGTQRQNINPVTPGNGTACVGTSSPTCAPYYCDIQSSMCHTLCGGDLECSTAGYTCVAGKCIQTIQAGVLTPEATALVIVAIVAAGFGGGVCWFTMQNGLTRCRSFGSGARLFRAPFIACAGICGATAAAIFAGFLLPRKWTYTPALPGTGALCGMSVADQVCAPFYCDTLVNKCYEQCTAWQDCHSNAQCINGKCIPYDQGPVRKGAIAVGVVMILFAFYLFFGPYFRNTISRLQARRSERMRNALRKGVDDFNRHIAEIQPAVIDLNPAVPDGKDNTMLSPMAGNGAGAFADPNIVVDAIPMEQMPRTDPLCSVCFTDPSTVRLLGRNCRHGFCNDCAQNSLQGILDNDQFPARCPGCVAEDGGVGGELNEQRERWTLIPSEFVERLVRRAIITIDLGRRFVKMQLMKAFHPDEVIRCPACDLLNIKPDLTNKNLRKPKSTRVECPGCRTDYCCKCNVYWFEHKNLTCEQLADKKMRGEDSATVLLIASTSKNCPNCAAPFVHYRDHACHHIAPNVGCPNCHFHFCCVCLQPHPCSRNGHDLFCDERCDCPTCPDCKPDRPCPHCNHSSKCLGCFPPGGVAPVDAGSDDMPRIDVMPIRPRPDPENPMLWLEDVEDVPDAAMLTCPVCGTFRVADERILLEHVNQCLDNAGPAAFNQIVAEVVIPPPPALPPGGVIPTRRIPTTPVPIEMPLTPIGPTFIPAPPIPDSDVPPPPYPGTPTGPFPYGAEPGAIPGRWDGFDHSAVTPTPTAAGAPSHVSSALSTSTAAAPGTGPAFHEGTTGSPPKTGPASPRVGGPAPGGPAPAEQERQPIAGGALARTASAASAPAGGKEEAALRSIKRPPEPSVPVRGKPPGVAIAVPEEGGETFTHAEPGSRPITRHSSLTRDDRELFPPITSGPVTSRADARLQKRMTINYGSLQAQKRTSTGGLSSAGTMARRKDLGFLVQVDPTDPHSLMLRTPMSAHGERMREFRQITGADENVARNFLAMFNWNTQRAVAYFHESHPQIPLMPLLPAGSPVAGPASAATAATPIAAVIASIPDKTEYRGAFISSDTD